MSASWPACASRWMRVVVVGLSPATEPARDHANADGLVTWADKANWGNLSSSDLTQEETTRYDALNRPTQQSVWLTAPTKPINPLLPPIATTATQGRTTTWTYDVVLNDGAGLDATYSLGSLNLGSCGMAVEVSDPLGNKTLRVQDGLGRVVYSRTASGVVTQYTYDAIDGGLVKSTVTMDPAGLALSQSRWEDGAGQVRKQRDALGHDHVQSYELDASDGLLESRSANALGHVTTLRRDVLGRQVEAVDAVGATRRWSYDALGNLERELDGLNNATTHTYDARSRKTRSVDRIAGQTDFFYDVAGNLTGIRDADANGRGETQETTRYIYDVRGLLTEEAFRDDKPTDGYGSDDKRTYTYDFAKRLATRKDQRGQTTTFTYLRDGRLSTRKQSKTDTFTYDLAGRMTKAVSGLYLTTVERSLRADGQLVWEKQTVGGTTRQVSYAYDTAGRLATTTYPNGTVVTQTLNADGLLAQVKWGADSISSFSYDAGHRETSRTLGNGLVETRTWRDDGLVSTIQCPGRISFSYQYDANKRKQSETDSILTGLTQNFGYDLADRLTTWSRTDSDGLPITNTQSWVLSKVGDWDSTLINGSQSETRVHNPVHQLSKRGSTTLSYDNAGNLTADGTGQTLAWDYENRLSTTKRGNVPTAANVGTVNPAGKMTIVAENAVTLQAGSTGYGTTTDALYQATLSKSGTLTMIARLDSLTGGADTATAGVVLRDGTATGARQFVLGLRRNADPVVIYRNATNAANTVVAGPVGLRAPQWLKVTRTNVSPYTFTAEVSSNGSTWTTVASTSFAANSTMQMGLVVTSSQSGSASTATFSNCTINGSAFGGFLNQYTYDAMGRRVAKQVQGVITTYVMDGARIASQYVGSTLDRSFVYGMYVDEPLAMILANGTKRFYHHNHLYSVSALTDTNGAVVERYAYDSYGKRTVLNANGSLKTGAALQDYGFTGREWDSENGLWYFRNRMYSDGMGRFVSRDRRFNDGFDLYAAYFVPNDRDPSGLVVLGAGDLGDPSSANLPSTSPSTPSDWSDYGDIDGNWSGYLLTGNTQDRSNYTSYSNTVSASFKGSVTAGVEYEIGVSGWAGSIKAKAAATVEAAFSWESKIDVSLQIGASLFEARKWEKRYKQIKKDDPGTCANNSTTCPSGWSQVNKTDKVDRRWALLRGGAYCYCETICQQPWMKWGPAAYCEINGRTQYWDMDNPNRKVGDMSLLIAEENNAAVNTLQAAFQARLLDL